MNNCSSAVRVLDILYPDRDFLSDDLQVTVIVNMGTIRPSQGEAVYELAPW